MTGNGVKNAVAEARRFIKAAETVLRSAEATVINGKAVMHLQYGRDTGALRRASMDLTRALADMRRPG